jgi:hypothetical protein
MPNPLAHLPPDLDLLDPTLDVVFERFFTEPSNEPLLRDLLQCTLRSRGRIDSLEVLGERLPMRHVDDKRFVVAAPVRVIVFLTFVAFPGLGLLTDFCLRDKSGRHVLTPKLEVIVVQMPRLDALDTSDPERHSDLARWIRFFQARTRAAYAALAAESITMSQAVEALAELSADRDLRRIAEDHAFALRLRERSIERRVQAALDVGREEGREEERRRTIGRILTKRFGAVTGELQARIDGASLEVLERWTERAIDASTLDDVFA